ncbi:MAG: phosphoserine transaminase [Candidatus Symbiobacter sp.]|nr:phosphoserine transaminase [Candidatus Symbiobacter sp.]
MTTASPPPPLIPKPNRRPDRPFFCSGPTAKHPGWTVAHLDQGGIFGTLNSRSHRSAVGREALGQAVALTRRVLRIPAGHELVIVGGSDTGAIEAAVWNLLGALPVTVAIWDRFAEDWSNEIEGLLKTPLLTEFGTPHGQKLGQKFTRLQAAFGTMPELNNIDFSGDVVFAWNSTTTGVQPQNGDWIPTARAGLTICDATSSVFIDDLPWDKLDVTSFSWQKGLGSEAQHGMLALSPRALKRLQDWSPVWAVPKLFQLKAKTGINPAIFKGEIHNTPSLLTVADYLDSLHWAESVGGLDALRRRVEENYQVVRAWVASCDYLDFACRDEAIRSPQSLCLVFTAAWFTRLLPATQREFCQKIYDLVASETAGYDFNSYPTITPPGLRFWAGPTVHPSDLQAVLPWIDWAVAVARQELQI